MLSRDGVLSLSTALRVKFAEMRDDPGGCCFSMKSCPEH